MAVLRAFLVWGALAAVVLVPIIVAAGSEYLQYRSTIYVIAGFAGIIGLAILLLQPLLASGLLPGLSVKAGRQIHRWTGLALLLSIALHIAGLWITSPPDMIDALIFTAPTAFSVFGVVAMWALVAVAVLAGFRKKLKVRPQVWRFVHTMVAVVVVVGSMVHALLIEGTMGRVSKTLLCVVLAAALLLTIWRLRPWAGLKRGR